MIELTDHAEGVLLSVVAHPSASRQGVLGERSGALRVAVTAPPDKGKANHALEKAIATALHCRPAQVRLESGQTSRRKRFLITGLDRRTIATRLATLVSTTTHDGQESPHAKPS